MALTVAVSAPGDRQVSVTLPAHKLITDVTGAPLTMAIVASY